METNLFENHQRIAIPANIPVSGLAVDKEKWLEIAELMAESGAQLLSLWGADDRERDGCFRIFAAYLQSQQLLVAEHAITEKSAPYYPSLGSFYPSAKRMQRAVYDLLGIATDETDKRGWLRHGGWPDTEFPLRKDFDAHRQFPVSSEPYPFVTVEGDGVHEIAVGPVHAGTIEPGHFRFSVVGEKVLRLEERLGYKHKGIAKRFEEFSQLDGYRLAGRISGDSTVAYSWAYCCALEAITRTVCTDRANALRALALEHERVANHLGDLGALGNDAGFAFGLTQFSRLKEDLLRLNAQVFGTRYLFDYILPGGVATDIADGASDRLTEQYPALSKVVRELQSIYADHAGLQDRFHEAGRLETPLAQRLGAVGLAGRASGIACDLRADLAWAPYDGLEVKVSSQPYGDVAARVQIRFDELLESIRLCQLLVEKLATDGVLLPVPQAQENLLGIGVIEGWRGPVLISLETGPQDSIRRCHFHDPSWQNWPLLEHAILGDIVPDFPLVNKSFNLSYSGQDG